MKKQISLVKGIILSCVYLFLLLSCKKEATSNEAKLAASSTQNRTTDASPPPPPQNVRIDPTYPQTPFSARLTWDAPPWTDVLIYIGSSSTVGAVVGYDQNLDPHYRYTLSNLTQNTSYTFRFQSRVYYGENGTPLTGPISEAFTFTTLPTNDHTPPTDPGNLAFACDPYTIYVTWAGSSDNYDPVSELTYEFYNVIDSIVIEVKNVNNLRVTNGSRFFIAGEKYYMRTRDRSGNRSQRSNVALLPLSCKV